MKLEQILKNAQIKIFVKDEIIFNEGANSNEGTGFVLEGELLVYKNFDTDKILLNEVNSKSFFGEIGILFDAPRRATIVVKSDYAKIIFINKDNFLQETRENTDFVFALIKVCFKRINNLFNKLIKLKIPYKLELNNELENELFNIRNSNYTLRTIIHNPINRYFKKDSIIYKENSDNNPFYLILTGEVEIKKIFEKEELTLLTLAPGDILGYLEQFNSNKHLYNAFAGHSNVSMIEIENSKFLKIIKSEPDFVFNLFKTLLIYLIAYEVAYVKNKLSKRFEITSSDESRIDFII